MTNQIDLGNGTKAGIVEIVVYEHLKDDKKLYSYEITVNGETFGEDQYLYKSTILALKKANSRLYGWIQRKLQS